MNVGSLFSGIGGFDLGFERAGMRTAFFVERDRYCQAVLRKHWPGVPIFDEVESVGAHNLPAVDVLCGGFPCQDISAAGRGGGLDGARSGLWSEFHRIIGELRPRYVVVENVPLLRSRGLGRILGEMAALGYDAEWDCIPACAVGAPHQRDRIWIVAYPQQPRLEGLGAVAGEPQEPEPRDGRASLADAERERWDGRPQRAGRGAAGVGRGSGLRDPADVAPTERGEGGAVAGDGGPYVADPQEQRQRPRLCADQPTTLRRGRPGDSGNPRDLPDAESIGRRHTEPWGSDRARQAPSEHSPPRREGGGSSAGTSPWLTEPDVGRVAHGVPNRVDRLRAIGNALVPQIAEWIGLQIIEWELR